MNENQRPEDIQEETNNNKHRHEELTASPLPQHHYQSQFDTPAPSYSAPVFVKTLFAFHKKLCFALLLLLLSALFPYPTPRASKSQLRKLQMTKKNLPLRTYIEWVVLGRGAREKHVQQDAGQRPWSSGVDKLTHGHAIKTNCDNILHSKGFMRATTKGIIVLTRAEAVDTVVRT